MKRKYPAILFLLFLFLLFFSCKAKEKFGNISVNGKGSVTVAPDIAHLRISISERGDTSKKAQILTNKKITKALDALHNAGIENKYMQTSALSFQNELEWNKNLHKNIITGRIVSQSISITFKDFDKNPARLANVLDNLGTIDGIGISNLTFDIEDSKKHYIKARKLAFQKAEQKARELADYAKIKLGKAISITEGTSYQPLCMTGSQQNIAHRENYINESPQTSELPGGEITISYSVHVVFETK